MEVILKQDIPNLGYKNDLITVKDGYARNYLIPKGLAIFATETNKKVLSEVKKQKAHKEEKILKEAEELGKALGALNIRIAAKADTVAKKRYDVTAKRYMIGKVNDVLELDKAQIDNDNALKNYYQALHTYWRSYYQIRKATLYDFKTDTPLLFDIGEIM